MKTLRAVPFLVVAAAVLGCDKAPTEQSTDMIGSPAFAADQNWIYDEFYQDAWMYMGCLGEDVHFYGPVPYQWHRVWAASGVYHYNYQIRPATPNIPPFYAETASGLIYLYKNGGPIVQTYQSGPGETFTAQDKETYVAESGDRLKLIFERHYTVIANGTLTADKLVPVEWTCIDK